MREGERLPVDDDGALLSEAERDALARWDEDDLGVHMARRYYVDDASKVAIAKAFGVSRFQVARLVADARRRGAVKVEVVTPGRVDRDLCAELQQALGVPRAVVVEVEAAPGPASPAPAVARVAAATAEVLRGVLREGDVLGMTWSRAIEAMSHQLDRLPRCTVVQLAGAVHPGDGVLGSVEVVRRVAAAAGSHGRVLYAPLVVGDAATAAGLRQQDEIASALVLGDRLDVAVLSVGAWGPSRSAVFDLLDARTQQEATDAGACGEVSGRLFDADGAAVSTSLDARVVGLTAEQLVRAPQRVATSHGAYRAEATRAAVRAGFATTLVVDGDLARAVLQLPP
ncbi:sugar-binding domain-containing protein [Pseudokineococcus basanitobsidens]|uniref:Sugar-binding domain-containing protein n=1 Tax=Pseudokineococcus basanitobsidens TaxID=1926649 RepID=A0ABU8RLL3_9ACTN